MPLVPLCPISTSDTEIRKPYWTHIGAFGILRWPDKDAGELFDRIWKGVMLWQ